MVYEINIKEYYQEIYIEDHTNCWRVLDYSYESLSLGNTIQITGELSFLEEARNPGNFDTKAYYTKKNILASVKVKQVEVLDDSVYPIREWLRVLRIKGVAQVYEILGEEKGAFLVAIVFGEKDDMDDGKETLYQKLGIAHIFAISGLHISLLSLVLYQCIRKSTGSFAIAGGVGVVTLCMYVILTGMGISAIRAGIMFGIRVGADITGRVYDIRTSLAVAAMWILSGMPNYLGDGGFLLSFGAIIGMIYVVPIWSRILHRFGKKGTGLAASVGIQIAVLPIILTFFYEVSPYSILINIVVIPLMTVLLGLAVGGILLSTIFYSGGAIFLTICGWILTFIDGICNLFITFPYARIITGIPWKWMVVLYYVVVMGCVFYAYILKSVKYKKNDRYYFMGAILCCVPVLLGIQPYNGDLQIGMLDIGQGDCFFVEGPEGSTYLIDGGSTDIYSVGKYRIEPCLRSMGVGNIDYVFVSHSDKDHMNGIEEMLGNQEIGIKIHTLVLCAQQFWDEELMDLVKLAQENGTEVAVIEAGDTVSEGEMTITCLAPTEDYEGEIGNASSMVLDISYGEFDMLCTGDVEAEGEEALLQILEESQKTYDVLKVAHHGSKNSTSEEFLMTSALKNTQIALISAGIDSAYGHPHKETMERLLNHGCKMYQTSIKGGVFLSYYSKSDTIIIDSVL